jgi:DNA-3-methyladenine glycosylase II
LDLTVWAPRRRAVNNIDRWDGSSYRRVLVVQGHPVEVEVIRTGPPATPHLQVTLAGTGLSPDAERVVSSTLSRMLGTNEGLTEFYRLAEGQPELDELAPV